jgi:hypothetical protein
MTDTRTLISSATNGATELPPARPGRKPVHGYISDESHSLWHAECAEHGISVTALLEILGPRLPRLLDGFTGADMVREARKVDAANRRRRR